jgi:predicted transglutaminase-like cysteine proteinase
MKNNETQIHNSSGILTKIKSYLDACRVGDLLVAKGKISADDLNRALAIQSHTKEQLGQIFINEAKISQLDLSFLLFKQRSLRVCAASLLCFISLTAISKKAHAGSIKDVPAQIVLANVGDYSDMSSHPRIYRTSEKRSKNLKAFTKWSAMFKKFDRQLKQHESRQIVKDWQKSLEGVKGQTIKAMAEEVNDLVNKKRYITDKRNWGKSDYWATPIEFLQRGGDCEDFAIMKYTALRSLGVPEDRLRVAIVQDTVKDIPHAVLVVYTEDGAFILDNQIKTLVSTVRGSRYSPIYSINRTAWWLHKAPSTTLVASAR